MHALTHSFNHISFLSQAVCCYRLQLFSEICHHRPGINFPSRRNIHIPKLLTGCMLPLASLVLVRYSTV